MLIRLPNGDYVESETIKALRLFDFRPCTDTEIGLSWRVVVDIVLANQVRVIVLDCHTKEQRDHTQQDIYDQIQAAKALTMTPLSKL